MACTIYMEFLLFLQNFDVISMQVKLVSVNETSSESLKSYTLYISLQFFFS